MIQAWVKARPKASSGAPDIQRVSTKQLALIIFNHFFFGGFLAANTFKQPSLSEKTRQTPSTNASSSTHFYAQMLRASSQKLCQGPEF
jgi:hypothetical protein